MSFLDGIFDSKEDETAFSKEEASKMDDVALMMAAIYEIHAITECTSRAITDELGNRILHRPDKQNTKEPNAT